MSAPFEMVSVSGTPRELGVAYGKAAADKVVDAVRAYRKLLGQAGVYEDKLARALPAKLAALERHFPHIAAELEGVADGAGLGRREEAMLLNARSELLSIGWPAPPAECTSVGVSPERSADGAARVAQTWDWFAKPFGDLCLVLRARPSEGPARLAFVEAGQLAKIGVNSYGLAAGINFLDCPAGEAAASLHGIPVHLLVRAVLEKRDVDEAIELLRVAPRGGAVNLLLADAKGKVRDVEVSPGAVRVIEPDAGIVTHANDFEAGLDHDAPRPCRSARARALLSWAASVGRDELFQVLRDHSDDEQQVCSHDGTGRVGMAGFSLGTSTVAAFVLEPAARAFWASAGPPCRNEPARYALDEAPGGP